MALVDSAIIENKSVGGTFLNLVPVLETQHMIEVEVGATLTFDNSPEWSIDAPVSSPRQLVATGAADQVRLSWYKSYESTVRRYDVYRGVKMRILSR